MVFMGVLCCFNLILHFDISLSQQSIISNTKWWNLFTQHSLLLSFIKATIFQVLPFEGLSIFLNFVILLQIDVYLVGTDVFK